MRLQHSRTLVCCLFLFSFGAPALAANEGKVALVMKALSNPFFSGMEAGARRYATTNDIPLEVFGVERETDVSHQIAIMENLIARDYGAIVIAPADSRQLVPVCREALDDDIVVINIDNPLNADALREHGIEVPFVGSDNRQGAAMVGRYLRRKLDGKGRVIVVEGIRGVENADLRKEGFIASVTEDSEIRIVASESANWHTDEAFVLMSRLLEDHGKVEAVFCANDKMALGALQAVDLFGWAGDVLIGAYDNIAAARNEMQQEQIHATVEQHPELMGRFGVALAAAALGGYLPPERTSTPVDLVTHETFGMKAALSVSERSNPFFSQLCSGVSRAADLFGMELTIRNANNSDTRQLLHIQNAVQKNVDLLLVNPTNTESVVAGIQLVNNAGIPVFTIDRKAARGQVVSHVESDNREGARLAAEFIAGKLDGTGRVVELEGIPGTSATFERGMAFNKRLAEHPGIDVVAREVGWFNRARARKAMESILNQDIAFDAVFAHNDVMILGAHDAIQSLPEPRRPILVGFDGIPEVRKAIAADRVTATIAQKPSLLGKIAVKSAVSLARGVTPPEHVRVDLELLTAETLSDVPGLLKSQSVDSSEPTVPAAVK